MSTKVILAAILVLAMAGLIFFIMAPAPESLPVKAAVATSGKSSPSAQTSVPDALPVADDKQAAASKPASGADIVAGSAEIQDAEMEAIREKIIDGVVTYSEEGLPAIKPYLTHPNPEVRAEAIDGMIQISVPAAAKILREAADKSSDPQDKIKMLEAAEFIELPSISPDMLRKNKSATNAP